MTSAEESRPPGLLTTAQPPITDESLIETWPLDWRLDDDSMILGRPDQGTFVRIPAIGEPIIVGIRGGLTPHQISDQLLKEYDVVVDVTKFLNGLAAKGFVRRVDGVPCPSPPLLKPALPWLRPRHVSWLATRWFTVAWILIAGSLIAAGILTGALRILSADYFIVNSPTANVLLNTLGAGVLVAFHEVAHISMARAYGQPGRIRLSSRLVFLVAESDVSSIRLVSQGGRIKTYLAGMAWDCMVLGAVATGYWFVGDLARRVIAAFIFFLASGLLIQFACFMRSDVYFVLQDVTGRPNLFPDALGAWKTRLTSRRAFHWKDVDSAVRRYAWFLLAGSLGVLVWFALVGAPLAWQLLSSSAHLVIYGVQEGQVVPIADGAIVLVVEGGIYAFLIFRWIRMLFDSLRDVYRGRKVADRT